VLRRFIGVVSTIVVAAALAFAVAAEAQDASDGGRDLLVEAGCAACHASDGHGTALGPELRTEALALADFTGFVRNPVRSMPAYGPETLTDQALARMYGYLRTLDPATRPNGRADVGRRLYESSGCYACHANEAQGGMHGPRLGPGPITFARFTWYVRHPSESMPPYSAEVLSTQQIADIYAFVAARPEPPPLERIPLLAP
jgi:mono/diheme cytochrome c family protein